MEETLLQLGAGALAVAAIGQVIRMAFRGLKTLIYISDSVDSLPDQISGLKDFILRQDIQLSGDREEILGRVDEVDLKVDEVGRRLDDHITETADDYRTDLA